MSATSAESAGLYEAGSFGPTGYSLTSVSSYQNDSASVTEEDDDSGSESGSATVGPIAIMARERPLRRFILKMRSS